MRLTINEAGGPDNKYFIYNDVAYTIIVNKVLVFLYPHVFLEKCVQPQTHKMCATIENNIEHYTEQDASRKLWRLMITGVKN